MQQNLLECLEHLVPFIFVCIAVCFEIHCSCSSVSLLGSIPSKCIQTALNKSVSIERCSIKADCDAVQSRTTKFHTVYGLVALVQSLTFSILSARLAMKGSNFISFFLEKAKLCLLINSQSNLISCTCRVQHKLHDTSDIANFPRMVLLFP